VYIYCVQFIGVGWWEVGAVGSGGRGLFVCVLIKMSNMGLCISVNVSFICRPLLVMSYIWNLSNVLSLGPFFSICSTFIIWSIIS
jgi:uncharacterized membrane protein